MKTNIDSSDLADVRDVAFDKAGDMFIAGAASTGYDYKGYVVKMGAALVKRYADGTQAWRTEVSTTTPGWGRIVVDGESLSGTESANRAIQNRVIFFQGRGRLKHW